MCSEHDGLEKIYYCNDCQVTVCPECFFDSEGSHTGHGKEIAKVVFEQRKAELETLVKTLDKTYEAFQKRGDEIVAYRKEIKSKKTNCLA